MEHLLCYSPDDVGGTLLSKCVPTYALHFFTALLFLVVSESCLEEGE
jgi:putative Ca2+/H+ antiporter (TMEM165/GDT1 family)